MFNSADLERAHQDGAGDDKCDSGSAARCTRLVIQLLQIDFCETAQRKSLRHRFAKPHLHNNPLPKLQMQICPTPFPQKLYANTLETDPQSTLCTTANDSGTALQSNLCTTAVHKSREALQISFHTKVMYKRLRGHCHPTCGWQTSAKT